MNNVNLIFYNVIVCLVYFPLSNLVKCFFCISGLSNSDKQRVKHDASFKPAEQNELHFLLIFFFSPPSFQVRKSQETTGAEGEGNV